MMLLTDKPVMFVCNVNEADAVNGNAYVEQVKDSLAQTGDEILFIAGKIEAKLPSCKVRRIEPNFWQMRD